MSDALLDRVWPTVASAYRMPDHSRNNASSSDLSFLGIDPASFLRFCKDTLCSIPVGDDMKGGLLLLAGTVGAAAMAMSFPQSVRDDVAARTAVPDHIYLEAERQLALFVKWARSEDDRPAQSDHPDQDVWLNQDATGRDVS